MSKVVIFPAAYKSEGEAYGAWTDATYAPLYEPGGRFSYPDYVREDVDGNWVAAYLGPNFLVDGEPIEEPEGGEAMRPHGVVHDFAVWPEQQGD